jgi:hypothetical protein
MVKKAIREDPTMPEMIFVDSTSIEAIGYDPHTQELHVRFLKTGQTYVYYGIDEFIFEEFKQAESKGTFLNGRIKPHYSFGKL